MGRRALSEELRADLRSTTARQVVIETGPLVTYAQVARTVDIPTALGYRQIHFAGDTGLRR